MQLRRQRRPQQSCLHTYKSKVHSRGERSPRMTEFGLQFLDARNARGILLRLAPPSVPQIWFDTMIKTNEKQIERGHCDGVLPVLKGKFRNQPEKEFTDEDWLHRLYLGSIKTRNESYEDEHGELRSIRVIHGHSGGMIISPRLMNYVMIPYKWKRFIYHVGGARDQEEWNVKKEDKQSSSLLLIRSTAMQMEQNLLQILRNQEQ